MAKYPQPIPNAREARTVIRTVEEINSVLMAQISSSKSFSLHNIVS